MTASYRASKAAMTLTAIVAGFILAGCSGDDIAFNGKIFDAVGVGSNSNKRSAEPKMAARQPLVVPPGLDRLPQPGTQPGAQENESAVAALNDPEKIAQVNQADLERQQAEYCKKNYHDKKLHDNKDVEEATGPLGPCRGSFLSAFQNWNKAEPQEGQLEE